MEVRFVAQPWADSKNLDGFLKDVSEDAELRSLTMAVAWAKRSAFSRIRPHLEQMRSVGAAINLVVGISEGGATRQGLELALDLADSVHVVHDPRGRTFHPKVYLAESESTDRLFVGSNNLTAGGLFYNYEAGLRIDIPHDSDKIEQIIIEVNDWLNRLRDDQSICVQLTPELLKQMVTDPRYRIGDEDHHTTAAKEDSHEAPEDSDSQQSIGENDMIFSASSQPMSKSTFAPSKAGPSNTTTATTKLPTSKNVAKSQPTKAPASVASWSKTLKGSDAQQPTPGSQATYNLRLSQSKHPIDHKTYFRSEFFANRSWSVDLQKPEVEFAWVDFRVSIHGTSLGVHKLRVDHNLDRVASQNNVATVLKWGDLEDQLRANNYVDDTVTISRLDDDSFTLDIS